LFAGISFAATLLSVPQQGDEGPQRPDAFSAVARAFRSLLLHFPSFSITCKVYGCCRPHRTRQLMDGTRCSCKIVFLVRSPSFHPPHLKGEEGVRAGEKACKARFHVESTPQICFCFCRVYVFFPPLSDAVIAMSSTTRNRPRDDA
jgi:hypothetical protein